MPHVHRMGWLIGGNVGSITITVLVGLAIARLLGPADFGAYSVVLVGVTFAIAITTFRLEQHLVTTLGARGLADSGWIHPFRDAVAGSVAIGSITYLSSVLAATVLLSGTFRTAAYIGLLEILIAPLFLARTVLQVRAQQRQLALLAVTNRVVWATGIGIVLIFRPAPLLVWVIFARLIAQVVEAAAVTAVAHLHVTAWRWRTGRRPDILLVLKRSLPLVGAGLAGMTYNRIDQPLIAVFLGRTQTGLYAGAARIAELIRMLPAVVENVMLPRVAHAAHQGDRSAMKSLLHDAALLMVVPGGLLIALFVGAGEHIMRALLGPDYLGAGHVVAILAAAEIAVFIGATYQMACLALDRRTLLLWSTVIGGIVNVAINLALLGSLGIVVAAWASLIGYGTAAAILTFGIRGVPEVVWPPLHAIARCLPAIVIGSIVAFATRSTLIVATAATVAAYGAIVALSLRGSLRPGLEALIRSLGHLRSLRR